LQAVATAVVTDAASCLARDAAKPGRPDRSTCSRADRPRASVSRRVSAR